MMRDRNYSIAAHGISLTEQRIPRAASRLQRPANVCFFTGGDKPQALPAEETGEGGSDPIPRARIPKFEFFV